MSAAAVARDARGEALGCRPNDVTGTWWGPCPTCGDRKASVGLTGFRCELEAAIGYELPA